MRPEGPGKKMALIVEYPVAIKLRSAANAHVSKQTFRHSFDPDFCPISQRRMAPKRNSLAAFRKSNRGSLVYANLSASKS
jgi:hypothetical protein